VIEKAEEVTLITLCHVV